MRSNNDALALVDKGLEVGHVLESDVFLAKNNDVKGIEVAQLRRLSNLAAEPETEEERTMSMSLLCGHAALLSSQAFIFIWPLLLGLALAWARPQRTSFASGAGSRSCSRGRGERGAAGPQPNRRHCSAACGSRHTPALPQCAPGGSCGGQKPPPAHVRACRRAKQARERW